MSGDGVSVDDGTLLWSRMLTCPVMISSRMCSNVLRERAVDFLNLERTGSDLCVVHGVSDKLTIPTVTIGRGIMYIYAGADMCVS